MSISKEVMGDSRTVEPAHAVDQPETAAGMTSGRLVAVQILTLIGYSFREARHKWTLIATTAATTVFLIVLPVVFNLDIVEGTIASARLMGGFEVDFGGIRVSDLVVRIQQVIAVVLNSFGIMLALFITGNVIPRTLTVGWGDLLMAQPIARPTLIVGRTLGAIGVVTANLAYLVLGSWAILTWKTGFGNAGFLSAGFLILVTYVACYAGMVLVGVMTRSSPVSVVAGMFIWFVGVPLNGLHYYEDWRFALRAGWARTLGEGIVDSLYWIMPKTGELAVGVAAAAQAETFSLSPVLWSLPFAIGCIGLACLWVSRQDY